MRKKVSFKYKNANQTKCYSLFILTIKDFQKTLLLNKILFKPFHLNLIPLNRRKKN